MERVSQLILRNLGRIGQGSILLINPPRDSCFRQLSEGVRDLSLFTQDFGDFKWLQESGAEVSYGVLPSPAPTVDHIILIQPRERDRLTMMLHALSATMSAEARLWLVGENRTGIKSSAKRIGQFFNRVSKTDSARHCGLFEAAEPVMKNPFRLSDYEKSWSASTRCGELDVISLPGAFAHGNLDKGSALLLDTLSDLKPGGQVLDFACGSGVIGLSLLEMKPEMELTLLDSSAIALESARRSLSINGRQATVVASDGLMELEGKFDWIVSNPPFHRGVDHDLEIVHRFFNDAGNFLHKAGKILLVCNQHLPYPAWLKASFKNVESVSENRGFKVIMAAGIRK
ncbi:methyltransferase [Pseudomonadota bacterium]